MRQIDALRRFYRGHFGRVVAVLLVAGPGVLYAQPNNAATPLTVGVYPVQITQNEVSSPADSFMQARANELGHMLATILHQRQDLLVFFPGIIAAHLQQQTPGNPNDKNHVQQLCADLAMQKLLAPVIEVLGGAPEAKQRWRMLLRWLDGASGDATKSHTVEFEINTTLSYDLNQPPAGFEAEKIISNLLSKPEFMLTQTPEPPALPASSALPELDSPPAKKRRWLWYLTGAAAVGGSAYWIFGRAPEDTGSPQLLPEPPGPPPK